MHHEILESHIFDKVQSFSHIYFKHLLWFVTAFASQWTLNIVLSEKLLNPYTLHIVTNYDVYMFHAPYTYT